MGACCFQIESTDVAPLLTAKPFHGVEGYRSVEAYRRLEQRLENEYRRPEVEYVCRPGWLIAQCLISTRMSHNPRKRSPIIHCFIFTDGYRFGPAPTTADPLLPPFRHDIGRGRDLAQVSSIIHRSLQLPDGSRTTEWSKQFEQPVNAVLARRHRKLTILQKCTSLPVELCQLVDHYVNLGRTTLTLSILL
jgi:hypothetical protein